MLLEIPPKCAIVEIMVGFRLRDTGHCVCAVFHSMYSFNGEVSSPYILACKEKRCGELRVSDVEGLLASVRLGVPKEASVCGVVDIELPNTRAMAFFKDSLGRLAIAKCREYPVRFFASCGGKQVFESNRRRGKNPSKPNERTYTRLREKPSYGGPYLSSTSMSRPYFSWDIDYNPDRLPDPSLEQVSQSRTRSRSKTRDRETPAEETKVPRKDPIYSSLNRN